MRGTPARTATAALDASAGARAPFDPRAILTSIGEVVYDWDLATDVISWGANAADVLGSADLTALSSGAEFALRVAPGSGPTRQEVFLQPRLTDRRNGVPYATAYVLQLKDIPAVRIADTGRWFRG